LQSVGKAQGLYLFLDNLPEDATAAKITSLLTKTRNMTFDAVEVYDKQNSIKFAETGVLSCKVSFKSKDDLSAMANEVVNRGCLRLGKNTL